MLVVYTTKPPIWLRQCGNSIPALHSITRSGRLRMVSVGGHGLLQRHMRVTLKLGLKAHD